MFLQCVVRFTYYAFNHNHTATSICLAISLYITSQISVHLALKCPLFAPLPPSLLTERGSHINFKTP